MELKVTDSNFNDILATDKLVMVDFWATWCGPCRAIAPIVEELSAEYEGRAVIAKCNVDECQTVPVQYGIRNIPTLLFFKGGQLVDRMVGAAPKSELVKKLDSLL
ncbi:MAG: thioredoxin [Bacteroidetes bacterium]|uniref:Thioredoxin n=1 Tax=Candidatus Cryptobacteroides faecipullorum TaxID=2840764 RepID=A0A9D9I7M2_9BACT|nr:thioredoxin [Candidatus Cryptobacteroides faecipullorum]